MVERHVQWDKVLGMPFMIARLKEQGWDTDGINEFTAFLKKEQFEELDALAGGALMQIRDTPMYLMMLELTALKHMLNGATKDEEEEQ